MDYRDKTQQYLAFAYSAGYFCIVLVVIFHGFPPDGKDMLNGVLGFLTAIQLNIIQYFFGSSKGSSDKDVAIKQLTAPEDPKVIVTTGS